MHTEKQVSPEFVGNIQRVIWRQTSAKLSNFRVVRHIAPRLQIQYFPPEVPFGQKSHDVDRSVGHFAIDLLSPAFKKSIASFDLEYRNDKLGSPAGIFLKLISQPGHTRTHGVGDGYAFGRTNSGRIRFSERFGTPQKKQENQQRAKIGE